MDDLIAFLRARLGEIEQRAQNEAHYDKDNGGYYSCPATWGKPAPDSSHENGEEYGDADCDCGLRERRKATLADVAAKREIVGLAEFLLETRQIQEDAGELSDYSLGRAQAGGAILRRLALPYADHPEYRAEWKP